MTKTRQATTAFKHFLTPTGCFENCQNNSLHFDPLFLVSTKLCICFTLRNRLHSLSNLSGPRRGGLKYLGLQIRRQVGVDGQNDELIDLGSQLACPLLQ